MIVMDSMIIHNDEQLNPELWVFLVKYRAGDACEQCGVEAAATRRRNRAVTAVNE